jgi:hypothetical protein
MIKKLTFIALALVPCLAYGADPTADLSVRVVPPGSGPDAPAQAVAQGYTRLMLNADFTTGSTTGDMSVCLNCGKYEETQGYQWYCGFNTILSAACAGNITYPYADGANGTALRITNGPCCYGDDHGRNGISTISQYRSQGQDFPLNGYFEYTVRYPEYNTLPIWSNFWSVDVHGAQQSTDFNTTEYDWGPEFHGHNGGGAGNDYISTTGTWNWACNNGGSFWDGSYCAWGQAAPGNPDIRNYLPNFDPTQKHTIGNLVYQVSPNYAYTCEYIDGQAVPAASQTHQQAGFTLPGNCALLSLNHDGSGGSNSSAGFCGADMRTNCHEGFERVAPVIDLTASCGYEGDYSCWPSGEVASVIVYSVRAWSCAAWQTSECSPHNPN